MSEPAEELVADEELDAACLSMQPLARVFVNAVRSRDDARTRAAFAAVARADVPLGRSPLVVLALVLADEVAVAEDSGLARRAERERCLQLAVAVARVPGAAIIEQARRLPARIASGERP